MRIGKLRTPVAIDRRTSTRVDGSVVPGWEPFVELAYVSIEPLSTREFIAAEAGQSEVSARITIRWISGLEATMRIRRLDDGRIYGIARPLEDNRSGSEWITLPCSEGVNDG